MAIERVTLTRQPGIEHVAPSPVSSHCIQASRCASRTSFNGIGPQNRSPAGLDAPIPKIGTVRCPTKRSTERSTSRTRAMRRSRHHTQKTDNHGRITNTVSISERPASAEDRAIPGHWEGDLLFGNRNSQIATLVERQTRYLMLVKVGSKDTETVVNALIKNARRLPKELYRSLTWDRGKEMADHRRFTLATEIQVYFCDPHHPWQRGTNENTNGLLRQYFPKGIDLSAVPQAKLNAVARQMNERPRKTLGYETPAERYRQTVASIG
jgi:IS30 family transposase